MSKIIRIDGNAYKVEDGVLFTTGIWANNTLDTDNWCEVEEPVSIHLAVIDREFGTNFQEKFQ